MRENLDGIDNIVLKQKGVGNKEGDMFITSDDASAKLSEQGHLRVEVTTLDKDIEEPVSIIKMDIEGAEIEAIEGAKDHIQLDKPQLLICT